MFKLAKFIGLSLIAFSAFMLFAFSAFAESDDILGCSGRVSGVVKSANVNAGEINFDSHPMPPSQVGRSSTDEIISAGTADGSILGIVGNIIAPGDPTMKEKGRELAACTELEGSSFSKNADGSPNPSDDEFLLKGYAWNTNLGFINFYCGTDELDVAKRACGPFDYKVEIGKADPSGMRILTGHAWNPTFGYIKFGNGEHQVTRDSSGVLSGYAWTEAGVWMNFSGVKVGLPGEAFPVESDEWCDDSHTKRVCIEIVDPRTGKPIGSSGSGSSSGFEAGVDGLSGVKVADGVEGYDIRVYLSDPVTNTAVDVEDLDDIKLDFNWKDTIKRDQRAGEIGSFDTVETPWDSDMGGVTSKPVSVENKSTFSSLFEKSKDGGYKLIKLISSYAPTSSANLSYTTSTSPSYAMKNDVFLTDAVGGVVEPNELILESITYSVEYDENSYNGTIHANGRTGVPLRFKPALFIKTLYANGLNDTVEAVRNVPVNFTIESGEVGNISATGKNVEFVLTMDEAVCSDVGANFDFAFYGEDSTSTSERFDFDSIPATLRASATLPEFGDECVEEADEYEDCIAERNKYNAACSFAGNAGIHSVVSYAVEGKGVSYYSNKLPRLASSVTNPVAVVHGNIYAPKAFSPSAAQKTQATGNVSVDIVRNTVNENVKKSLKEASVSGSDATCVIKSLEGGENGSSVQVEGCTTGTHYQTGKVDRGVEANHYIYFNGSDVKFDLNAWSGNWTVIVEGGRVFVDEDIYSEDGEPRLALVAMREEGGSCADANIYIDKNVKNIQANIAADCSIFSYDSTKPSPILSGDTTPGLPSWDSLDEMAEKLQTQLFIEGSIASRNTIGGADLDSEGKDYLLLGTGRTVGFSGPERFQAQLYDLNYLRLFRLKLEISPEGLPIDQICGKALTIEDMLQISQKKSEAPFSSITPHVMYDGKECDGINPLNRYKTSGQQSCFYVSDLSTCSGDLVVPVDTSKLSRGLPADNYEPVYIFYKPPASFVFDKATSTTTN
jgi:hypothetical protein